MSELKYTKSERFEVEQTESLIKKLKEQKHKLNKKRLSFNERVFEKISDIDKLIFAESDKISKINNKLKKRCKHKGERHYWRNLRDDASFEKYCACNDCDEILWDECK